MKKVFSILLALVVLVSFVSPTFASTKTIKYTKTIVATYPKASPTPTPMAEVNSFEMFWPITAGKTLGESLYSLKTLKEDLRGALIFGRPQKAEYDTFVATKRLVEAEKLIKDNKLDLAEKTVDSANKKLTEANEILGSLKGTNLSSIADNVNNRLDRLTIFLDYLETKTNGSLKEKLQTSDRLVDELSTKI
ncbi:hypothetical protein KW795_02215 [Candidatus Microgenomates bacterium]|nr:hypothetical protein [Candidatus Microgenomates bacterium]